MGKEQPTNVPRSRFDSNENVEIDKMVKLTKTYQNGNTTVLYAAARCNEHLVGVAEPKFFDTPHGSRETVSCHKSGMIVSSTDNHCTGAPVRRRAIFMLVWSVSDESWMTWTVESYTGEIRYGKRLIDEILKTGILPN